MAAVHAPSFPGAHLSSCKGPGRATPGNAPRASRLETQPLPGGKREQLQALTSLRRTARGRERSGDFSCTFLSAPLSASLSSSGVGTSCFFLHVPLLDLDLGLRPSDVKPRFCYSSAENGRDESGKRKALKESPAPFLIITPLQPGKYLIATHSRSQSKNGCEGGEV